MKKLFTLLVLLISITSFANTVIVKGYVKDSPGKGVASRNVRITTDTLVSNTNCLITHYKLTDANGFYIDTLTCNSDIKKLRIYTESCGIILINDPQVTTTNIVESNFTICNPPTAPVPPPVVTVPPPPVTCTAYFVFVPQMTGVKFNSNVSVISPNDTIVSRKWSFGDGDSSFANQVDPTHTYTKMGSYNACLSIRTAKGCESKICKMVILGDSLSPIAGSTNEPVKIVRVYPNPVHEKLNMLVWSLNNSIAAEISIVDIYGQKKWSKKISLLKGNNSMDVNVSFLVSGPYFFKVNTAFGVVSYKFYKL